MMMKLQLLELPVDHSTGTVMPVSSRPCGECGESVGITKTFSQKSSIFYLVSMLVLLCFVGAWASQFLHHRLWPLDTAEVQMVAVILLIVYAICMMLPYLPAIELGLILLATLDIEGVMILYLVTVAALSISYAIGRTIPVLVLQTLFRFLHLHKASELFCARGECDEKEQIDRFIEHAPKKMVPFLLKHRYCVLAVLVNTPGNMIIGGAGGIAMMSGMSRVFGPVKFVATVLLAVSPLPVIAILSKFFIT